MPAVRGALEDCAGVKSVDIDLDKQLATVAVDETKADPSKLVEAVKAARDDFADTTVKTD